MDKKKAFFAGLKSGVPIGIGYFAVAFTLGITARSAGINAIEGFFASLTTKASAGEFAVFTAMAEGASYLTVALITAVTNARYFLMSCALGQRLAPHTPYGARFMMGLYVTDEIFGVTIMRQGYIEPMFMLGCGVVAGPLWALGTSVGIAVGNVLPLRALSALSVALYGMFLSVIVPAAKTKKSVLVVILISFAASFACSVAPYVSELSGGTRTIILTVVISAIAALIRPVDEVKDDG